MNRITINTDPPTVIETPAAVTVETVPEPAVTLPPQYGQAPGWGEPGAQLPPAPPLQPAPLPTP